MTESASTATPAVTPGTYRLDPSRSTIRADVKAMFGLITVHGTFRLQSGEVTIAEDGARSSVRATIDATSFSSGNATRDKDVVSPALLDASAYPEITFTGEGARPQGTEWVVPGSVTVRGVAVPTDLRMDEVRNVDSMIRFHAVANLDRTQFGVTKKKGMVGQNVALAIEAVAVPAEQGGPR
jgi:polyisoprenoid-binding protein YceI